MKLSKFLVLTVIIVLLFTVQAGVSAATLFSDDFEDGNYTGWSKSGGSWSVVTDGTKVFKQASTSAISYAYTGSTSWTNYSIQARAKILTFNGTGRPVGVTARFSSTSNFYYAVLKNGNQLELGKKVSGGTTALASKSYSVNTGTWYTLKLSVNGSQLQFYVNNVLELTATDSTFSSGKIGLYTYNTAAEFDDILVESGDVGATPTPTPTNPPATSTPTPTPTNSPTATPTPTPTTGVTPTPTNGATPTPTPTQGLVMGAVYVAPNGTDNNPGTIEYPTTLTMAISRVQSGGVIYLRGGAYSYETQVTISQGNNGTSNAKTRLFAYGSEKPVLDFSSQPYISNDVNPRGIRLDGNYWHIKGLEIKGAADNGMYISGNYNTIELCIFHNNRDSGLQLGRYSEAYTSISQWPSYNLILNCDSYANDDPDNHEDADGYGCKLTTGYGNIFRGCIAHHNNDDGWDLFMKPETGVIGPVTLENCIAYSNGYHLDGSSSPGDGNGFKLGGNGMPCDHILIRCIAFGNRVKGFWGNGNGGTMTVTNCTGYDNRDGANFRFDKGSHIFKNNLSYLSTDTDYHFGTDVESTNIWWKSSGVSVNGKGLVVDASDFVSLTPTVSRNSDGSINLGNFLKLAPGSDLINTGTPSGTDIGAVESQ